MDDQFGPVAKGLLKEAVRLFQNDEQQRCEKICHKLLGYPQLGDFLKAGCHLLLAQGQDNVIWHSEKALDIYEHLFEVRPGSSFSGKHQPTDAALQRQAELVEHARAVLKMNQKRVAKVETDFKKQMDDYVDYYGHRPTDTQLIDADMERYRPALDSYFAHVEAELAKDLDAFDQSDEPEEEHQLEIDDEAYDDDLVVLQRQGRADPPPAPPAADPAAASPPMPPVTFGITPPGTQE